MGEACKTILLVEDEPDAQSLILTSFEFANLPLSFQVVENGQEALNYLSGKQPYADRECYPLPVMIMTNISLPYMSGFDLLEWVKQHPKLRHLPVMVISVSDDPDDLVQAAKLGACSYFVKTSSYDDLIDIVAEQVL
ncbi:MAG: response regulator [Brasilonema angustatum HA4187-MV1]|jgi:CheY-like chemotaxis protein|nr:response regulator [Brasilonema angustatum HA4187-MV1]